MILKGWEMPEAIVPLLERIQPKSYKLFHGDLDEEKLGFFEKLVVKGRFISFYVIF
jgi:hypothetical protein